MSNKESFGGEIAKQLPVKEIYHDLVHPSLSEVGKALQSATKLALLPISGLVWGYDRVADYLSVAVPEYFAKKKVAKEKIVTPDPAVAVPLVETMRYTSHQDEIKKMFTNLLGASMNMDTANKVHPSYVEIVKQMNSLDAKVFRKLYLTDERNIMATKPIISLKDKGKYLTNAVPEWFLGWELTGHDMFAISISLIGLSRLGLITLFEDKSLVNGDYSELKNSPLLLSQLDLYRKIHPNWDLILVSEENILNINNFGAQFAEVCLE